MCLRLNLPETKISLSLKCGSFCPCQPRPLVRAIRAVDSAVANSRREDPSVCLVSTSKNALSHQKARACRGSRFIASIFAVAVVIVEDPPSRRVVSTFEIINNFPRRCPSVAYSLDEGRPGDAPYRSSSPHEDEYCAYRAYESQYIEEGPAVAATMHSSPHPPSLADMTEALVFQFEKSRSTCAFNAIGNCSSRLYVIICSCRCCMSRAGASLAKRDGSFGHHALRMGFQCSSRFQKAKGRQ